MRLSLISCYSCVSSYLTSTSGRYHSFILLVIIFINLAHHLGLPWNLLAFCTFLGCYCSRSLATSSRWISFKFLLSLTSKLLLSFILILINTSLGLSSHLCSSLNYLIISSSSIWGRCSTLFHILLHLIASSRWKIILHTIIIIHIYTSSVYLRIWITLFYCLVLFFLLIYLV